ncbi:MAG: YraN family protein [Bacillota bacterium]|jgi:putative endonuclease|nr:YraN family protein [Bacillota bacterium]HHU43655.1 YraN family protein [Clostridiales bacterium]
MDKYYEGVRAEVKAKNFLIKNGYQILDENVSYKNTGELDLVAKDGQELVFIEVRYRKDDSFGHPLETLTKSKINRIIKAARLYLCEKSISFSGIRFDVVSVTDMGEELIKNAFFARWN